MTKLFFIIALLISSLTFALTNINIAQVPLTQAITAHPQVLIALANSQSMDGTMSGAIMTGSGSLGSTYVSLQQSSSPVNYLVPTGFTPPLQAADASGYAPYSVLTGSTWYDNGASRLNVAKEGIQSILNTYMQDTDFALETYSTSNVTKYTTWVYYMSPTGGFTFSSSQSSGTTSVVNPCFVTNGTLTTNCNSIATLYGTTFPGTNNYLNIQATSDDASINDVLYAGSSLPGIFVTYNGPTPATPYPPNYSLTNYNNGSVILSYSKTAPSFSTNFATGPTNAGYVPYSPQVWYAMRGFAYGGSQSATSGNVVVPMTSAGNSPSQSSLQNALNQFTNYLEPETDRTTTNEIKAVAGQSPMAGLLTRAKTYLASLNNAVTCPPKQYVIFISDGLPTQDLSGKYWPPLGSAAATGYGVTATFNADGSLNSTNSQALTDTITAITNLKNAGIKTFIVGLGAGVDPTLNPQAAATLRAMAMAGGTIDYYSSSDMSNFLVDLNNIMISVQSGDFTTTSASVSSTRLTSTSKEYQASFTSNDSPYQDWTGDLYAKALDANTGFPTGSILWSSQTAVDALNPTNRIIAIWNPTLNSNAGGGSPFEWTSLSSVQRAHLQPRDTLGQSRLNYLRGNTSAEKRNGGTFRNRSHILGDIIYSQPEYVGPPDAVYSSTSYQTFRSTYQNRPALLYVGANDGMLHAFYASNGVEKFAFIPNAVADNLFDLASPLYNQSHLFYVNGSPKSYDVQWSDGSWHTELVGGEGGGGKSIYAIDITDPNSITSENALATKILWEFTDQDLGYTYSEPVIAPINMSSSPYSFAVFFGNGYNSGNNNTTLYAVNPQTGAIIRKMNLCSFASSFCDNSQPQGLSSIAVAYPDGIQGQAVNTIYAGDLQGNLWAIDVSSSNPASWTARVLFKARDASGNPQPITTAPVVTLQPSYPRLQGNFVMFGTGRLLSISDLADTQTQTVYGVWDKPVTNTTFTRANLQSQTLTYVSAQVSALTQDILLSTNNTVNWGTNVGWYTDLPIPGQRVVTQPQLLNGVLILTLNTPPVSCNEMFRSMLMEVAFGTGGSFQYPQLDITADGVFNSQDMYQNQYATGIGLLTGYATTPTIIGPNINNNFLKLISQSGGQQSIVINPNNSSRKTGWWQIK